MHQRINPRRKPSPVWCKHTRSYSITGVARALGMNCETAQLLFARGWLKFRAGRISFDALRTFVESPTGWLVRRPEKIRDPVLRAYAQTARGTAWRMRWISGPELAAYYHLNPYGIGRWRTERQWPSPDAWVQWIWRTFRRRLRIAGAASRTRTDPVMSRQLYVELP